MTTVAYLEEELRKAKSEANFYKNINNSLKNKNQKYKEVIDKAIDKLYCWGEVLDADFQKIMLDILKVEE